MLNGLKLPIINQALHTELLRNAYLFYLPVQSTGKGKLTWARNSEYVIEICYKY